MHASSHEEILCVTHPVEDLFVESPLGRLNIKLCGNGLHSLGQVDEPPSKEFDLGYGLLAAIVCS